MKRKIEVKIIVFALAFCVIALCKKTSYASEFATEELDEQYEKVVGEEETADWEITEIDTYTLNESEFLSMVQETCFEGAEINKTIEFVKDNDCAEKNVIKPNEIKTINWSSKKFETGLPGYKWSWSLTVNLKANNKGNGYTFDSATYSVITHTSYLQIMAMQYEYYSCEKKSDSCVHSIYSDRVKFDIAVVYDISYLLQGQTFTTSLSVPGSDNHEVQLTK